MKIGMMIPLDNPFFCFLKGGPIGQGNFKHANPMRKDINTILSYE